MVVLSKDATSLSKLECLLKWSLSSLSDGSLSLSVKFNFAETSPGFPCRFFSLHFYFLIHFQIPLSQFYQHYLQMYLHHPIELLWYSHFFQAFWLIWCVWRFFNPGLAAPFDAVDSLCNPVLLLGFDFSPSLMVLLL